MKKSLILLAGIIFTSPYAYANQADVTAWQSFLEKQMPREIGDRKSMGSLMRPKVGGSFSRSLSPSTLSKAFGGMRFNRLGNLQDGEEVYSGTRRSDDPIQLRFDRHQGKVHYSNRNVKMNPEGPENEMSNNEAVDRTLMLAKSLRIPSAEYFVDIIRVTPRMMAYAQVNKGDIVKKRMETVVTLPRCLQVTGISSTKCVFVAGSGLRAVWADPNNSPLDPPLVWLKASWPDFRLVRARGVLSRKAVAGLAAGLLSEQGSPDGVDRLEFGLAYTLNHEVLAQQGLEVCSKEARVAEDDRAADRERLEYVPTIVIYAIATEEDSRFNRRKGDGSSGVSVLSIPLVKTCS